MLDFEGFGNLAEIPVEDAGAVPGAVREADEGLLGLAGELAADLGEVAAGHEDAAGTLWVHDLDVHDEVLGETIGMPVLAGDEDCGGVAEGRHAVGTRGSRRGRRATAAAAAASAVCGTGTKLARRDFGSSRRRASIFSCTKPGTSQSRRCWVRVGTASAGMMLVMRSFGRPVSCLYSSWKRRGSWASPLEFDAWRSAAACGSNSRSEIESGYCSGGGSLGGGRARTSQLLHHEELRLAALNAAGA